MITLSVISLLVAALIIVEVTVRRSDFFSPGRIYLFLHALTMGIAFLSLDKAMTPFQPFTWLVYLGSGAAYLLGVWIAWSMGKLYPHEVRPVGIDAPYGKNDTRGTIDSGYNWTLHLKLAMIFFLLFVAALTFASLGIGTLPILAKDKAMAIRNIFKVNIFSSIGLSYGGMVAVLFFMAIFRPRRRRLWFNLAFWMMLVTLGIYITALSRSGLVFFTLFALVYYHQAVRRLSIPKLSIFFLVSFSLFLGTAYLKLTNFQKQYGLNVKPAQLMVKLLNIPYIYVANNFWNLDYALNPEVYHERHPATYGFTTVSGIFDMLLVPGGSAGSAIRDAGGYDDQFQEHVVKVKGLNTVGYQWGLYKDFGLPGTLLCPFAFGLLFGLVYGQMRRSPTVANTALYAYLSYFVGMSWFLAFWESMIYIYGLMFVSAICYLGYRIKSGIRAIEPDSVFPIPAVPGE